MVEIAAVKGLATSGTKAELVSRILSGEAPTEEDVEPQIDEEDVETEIEEEVVLSLIHI